MLWLYLFKMLDQSHNTWQSKASQQINYGVSGLVKGSRVVVGILNYLLRICRQDRYYRANYVSALCQIHQLLGVTLRSHDEQPIPDGATFGGREHLECGEPCAGLEIFSDDETFLCSEVSSEDIDERVDICVLVAGEEEHDPDLVLSFEFL